MNQDSKQVEPVEVHPFERTLGPGPYRFVAFFDLGAVLGALQAGNINGYNNGLAMAPKVEAGMGTCAHCGHAILSIFVIETGEKRRFGVGSDCIAKASLPSRELSAVKRAELAHQKKLRAARKVKNGAAARLELASLIETKSLEIESIIYNERSLLSYATWCLEHSNDGGIVIVLKRVKALLEGVSK